ncbi:cell adhesion molecule 2-like [Amphiura filiformis]|uniref:cell adhesion molecule 2-like n=1 Tax=Amphiura filiformis TaxID=82378 RepID=UPI003B225139
MEVVSCLLCFIFIVTSFPVCFCTTYINTTSGGITNGQMIVNNGSSISLVCTVNKGMNGEDGSALWDRSSIPITYNDNVLQDADKYGITKRDSPTGNYTRYILEIRRVTLMDEDNYTCQNIKVTPPETQRVHVYVSFPPISFKMTQNGSDVTMLKVLDGDSSDIVCTSIGSRPDIDIWWYHRMKEDDDFTRITKGVSQHSTINVNNTLRFDTVSTLRYIASKQFDGGVLKCEVIGLQMTEKVDAMAYLDVQYSLSMSGATNFVAASPLGLLAAELIYLAVIA